MVAQNDSKRTLQRRKTLLRKLVLQVRDTVNTLFDEGHLTADGRERLIIPGTRQIQGDGLSMPERLERIRKLVSQLGYGHLVDNLNNPVQMKSLAECLERDIERVTGDLQERGSSNEEWGNRR